MRFVLPVHAMRSLELVRAVETDDSTLAAAVEVGRRLGKQVNIVLESH
jgi:3-hydroxyacyl-CoA dehydrogenase